MIIEGDIALGDEAVASQGRCGAAVLAAVSGGLCRRHVGRRMLFLVGAMFLSGCGGLMFYNHLGGIFTARLDASAANVTVALLIVGLVGVLAVLFGGILTDEAGPRRADTFVLVGHCLALGGLALYLGDTTGSVTLATFVLVGVWSIFAWA